MGYTAAYSGTTRVTLTDPSYWVDLYKCLSRAQLGAAEALLTQAVLDLNGNASVRPDVVGYRNAMVQASLAAWNLDDDNGQPLPPNVGMLAGPDFDLIWAKVDALNKGMTPAEQQRFPDAG